MRIESRFVWLIEFKLHFVNWLTQTILLKSESFCHSLFVWLDVGVIRLNAHFMHIRSTFVMYDMVFLVLVKRLITKGVMLIALFSSELT